MLLSLPLVAGAPVAQLDRASASGAEGHRFKSCQAHQTECARAAGFVIVFEFGTCGSSSQHRS